MAEIDTTQLSSVSATLLMPLYARALESRRPDAVLTDPWAADLVDRIEALSPRARRLRIDPKVQLSVALRSREFDRHARAFMAHSPGAVVVQIGCGLDSRFRRVDDGQVEWYDLDLPKVIDLRWKLIGDEGERHHLLAGSVLDGAWLDWLGTRKQRPMLFLAEGVLMYFEEAQVRALVLRLRQRFPGAELVCDVLSPWIATVHNLRLRLSPGRVGARYRWAPQQSRDLEAWGSGIRLLTQWYLYDRPEPRLAGQRWVRRVPALARVMGVLHYRLGNAAS
ncbi:MAG: class I SAM-dependent methyltransferase [Anaerolineae bacterium]